ncbi:hypothetical protein HNY73_008356 [Argiope bruennichi]|uniref:Uncharacterized protein n=1 Tax=Argiope bruennichi TaxID=94029 RepID=A0A8T0FBD6_ARGBR|nr:hypothetical protein HNY73_008356 [Argiope bruennichi]
MQKIWPSNYRKHKRIPLVDRRTTDKIQKTFSGKDLNNSWNGFTENYSVIEGRGIFSSQNDTIPTETIVVLSDMDKIKRKIAKRDIKENYLSTEDSYMSSRNEDSAENNTDINYIGNYFSTSTIKVEETARMIFEKEQNEELNTKIFQTVKDNDSVEMKKEAKTEYEDMEATLKEPSENLDRQDTTLLDFGNYPLESTRNILDTDNTASGLNLESSNNADQLFTTKEMSPFYTEITTEQNIITGIKTAEDLPATENSIIKIKRELSRIFNSSGPSNEQVKEEHFKRNLNSKRKALNRLYTVTETNNQYYNLNKINRTIFESSTVPELFSLVTKKESNSDMHPGIVTKKVYVNASENEILPHVQVNNKTFVSGVKIEPKIISFTKTESLVAASSRNRILGTRILIINCKEVSFRI